ncbi:hypothetical protein C3E98_014925 [Pseudomonas sp. MWU13-2625]|nr:hypothetical protein C3E98_014925 [Pseudomonas sp. MWU13-2625]
MPGALQRGVIPFPHVGAGLLAKASCQAIDVSTDPPHSRASPLPQVFDFSLKSTLDHSTG